MGAGAVGSGLSLASTGLSAFSSVQSGQNKADAAMMQGWGTFLGDAFKADQADLASAAGRVRATQTSSYMLDNLGRQLSNINAITAAGGADPNSPSNFAVMNATRGQSDRARQVAVSNINMQADSDKASAAWYRASGVMALMGAQKTADSARDSGWLSAGGDLLKSAAGLNIGSWF